MAREIEATYGDKLFPGLFACWGIHVPFPSVDVQSEVFMCSLTIVLRKPRSTLNSMTILTTGCAIESVNSAAIFRKSHISAYHIYCDAPPSILANHLTPAIASSPDPPSSYPRESW